MLSRNRDVSYPDFALMASAHLYASLRGVLHNHDTFLFLAGAFKDKVDTLRSIQRYQLFVVDFAITGFHFDKAWQLTFAYFAFKLGEIVVLSASYDIFLDLDANPLSKARVMHSATRSITLARVK